MKAAAVGGMGRVGRVGRMGVVGVIGALLGACVEPASQGAVESELADPIGRILRIKQLEVGAVTDSGLLEVEVHLVNAATGATLGCSGMLQGLNGVDGGQIRYDVNAHFVRPGGILGYPNPRREWLTESDVQGVELRAIVVEDDLAACPTPQGTDDDLIGRSKPMRLDGLGGAMQVEMESAAQVPMLVLGY